MGSRSSVEQLLAYARAQAGASRLRWGGDVLDIPEDSFRGYRVINCIGRGGQGTVYRGVEETTGRAVAIKVLRQGPFRRRAERMRFDREVRILAELSHPHIVTIHSSGTVQQQVYFIMDYVPGCTLGEYMRCESPSIDSMLAMFLKICDAVHVAHLHGIVHRDLKPSNIRIDEHGEPRVIDFGLAKRLVGEKEGATAPTAITLTGQFVGSLPWAAPEQLTTEADSADLRTDVYGLGLLLYSMLAGKTPFDRPGSVRDVMGDILSGEVEPLSEVAPHVDLDLETIVSTCLRTDPGRRYQIAGELARDIKRYRAGLPIEARRDSTRYVFFKFVQRYRAITGLVLAIVALVIGYGITVSVLYGKSVAAEELAEQRAADARNKYVLARDVLEFVVGEVTANLKESPQSIRTRQAILQGAFDRLSTLVEQHGGDPLLQRDLMRTHYQLGKIAIDLGRSDLAESHLREALDLRLAIHKEQPATPEERAELSINYVHLGDVAFHTGKLEKCESFYREAFQIDRQLVDEYPGNAHFLDNLAWSHDRMGGVAWVQGEKEFAAEHYEEQLRLMERLVALEPENPVRYVGLAEALRRAGTAANNWFEEDVALEYFASALAASRRSLELAPDSTEYMRRHVDQIYNYVQSMRVATSPVDVADLLEEGVRLSRRLMEHEPDMLRNKLVYAKSILSLLSSSSYDDGELERERLAREVLLILESSSDQASASIVWHRLFISVHNVLRATLIKQGRNEEAQEQYAQALHCAEMAINDGIEDELVYLFCVRALVDDPEADRGEFFELLNRTRDHLLADKDINGGRYSCLANAYRKIGATAEADDMMKVAESLNAARHAKRNRNKADGGMDESQ